MPIIYVLHSREEATEGEIEQFSNAHQDFMQLSTLLSSKKKAYDSRFSSTCV